MRTIASSQYPVRDHFLGDSFAIVSQAEPSEKINKRCGKIQSVVSQFGRFIVPRKDVVVVVPTFSHSQKCNSSMFRRINTPE